jgi:hypothetical protein
MRLGSGPSCLVCGSKPRGGQREFLGRRRRSECPVGIAFSDEAQLTAGSVFLLGQMHCELDHIPVRKIY